MRKSSLSYALLLLVLLVAESSSAELFSGEFTATLDGEIHRLSIFEFARTRYEGEYRAAGERLPLSARRFGETIVGRIGSADTGFGFQAQLQNGGLLLRREGGQIISFRRSTTTE